MGNSPCKQKKRGPETTPQGKVEEKTTDKKVPPPKQSASAAKTTSARDAAPSDLKEFHLKKKRPGCTGMFWRGDPRGRGVCASPSVNWPRDGATLRGVPHDVDGKRWLEATHVKQANAPEWREAPAGAWMPFEYDNHYYLEAV